MKKTNQVLVDDMRPEYDFPSMKGGVRGKYARRAQAGTNIVVIEQEVTDAFPTERAVNEALKCVLNTARAASTPWPFEKMTEWAFVSPTVLRRGPYQFFIFASDRQEPPHVHVKRDDKLAKF